MLGFDGENPALRLKSLVAEGDHGVDAHGAAGGDGARCENNDQSEGRGGSVNHGISGTHRDERGRKQPAESNRDERAGNKSGQPEKQTVHHNHAHYIRGTRAQCNADADFVGAANDGLSHHGVQADRSKQNRRGGENTQEIRGNFLREQRLLHVFLERNGVYGR